MAQRLDNKQLYDNNNERLNEQEDLLNDILVNVGEIGNNANEIKKEINHQDGLIEELKIGTDNNVEQITKTKNKLDDILKSQSYCKLYLILLVEIVILIALISIQ